MSISAHCDLTGFIASSILNNGILTRNDILRPHKMDRSGVLWAANVESSACYDDHSAQDDRLYLLSCWHVNDGLNTLKSETTGFTMIVVVI